MFRFGIVIAALAAIAALVIVLLLPHAAPRPNLLSLRRSLDATEAQ